MNSTSTISKYLLFLFFIAASTQLNAQCSTNIASSRDTISCGDSLELQQIGVGGASSDDFTASTLSGLWQSVTSGYTIGGPCGTNPNGGQHLWFGAGSPTPRSATTIPVDASCGGDICFDFRQETQGGTCDGPDQSNEGVYLQYKVAGGVWTQIFYFNPVGYPYTGWNNYCYPIPLAAQTSTTQFRWIQTNASGTGWDFWGIDNVNIATCTGYSPLWSGGAIPASYTQDSVIVAPYATTTYSLVYSNWVDDTCYATKTIVVEQPTVNASVTNIPCALNDTLNAEATIKSYCSYTLELWNYLPGGASNPGWTVGTNPQTYHNLDVNINSSLYSNYTMSNGANATSVSYSIPVSDGDQFSTIFTSLGNAANECLYKVFDSGNNLLTQQGAPGGVPGSFNTVVSCPSSAVYNYTWSNLTSGGTTDITNPSSQSPLVSVSVPTQIQVFAYDNTHPLCNITDTISVTPNSTVDISISGATAICEGETVTLGFALTGTPPFTLLLDTGGAIAPYTLDINGTVGGNPITFIPSSTTTYTITSITDSTGCNGAISTASLTTTVNTLPYSGVANNQEICINSTNSFNMGTLLTNEDPGGVWTTLAGVPVPPSINPNTYGAGTHQFIYTVLGNAPCPDDSTVANLTIFPQPIVSSFTASPTTVPQTVATNLTVVMSAGTPNFTINIVDNAVPMYNGSLTIVDPNMSGTISPTPIIISPGTNTYSITSIVDANGCTASSNLTADVIVEPTPAVNPFVTLTPEVCQGTIPNLDITLAAGVTPVAVYYSYNGTNHTQVFNAIGSVNIDLDTTILNLGLNTITIDSVVDNSGTHSPPSLIPAPLSVTVNENPSVTFSTTTSEICFNEDGILSFDFLSGEAPYNVDYTINAIPQTPLNLGAGLQNHTLNPQAAVGNNTYSINLITDNNNCTVTPSNTVTIAVNPTPVLGINISGANPICFGDASAINFPVTSGTPPYVVNYSDAGTPTTINVDANGNLLSSGMALVVNPITATTYTLNNVTDSKGCTNTFANNAILDVKELPNVSISSDVEICEQDVTALAFNFDAGSTPWTVNYTVNGSPSSVTLNNPNDNVSISPSVTTTYIINSVSDAFCTTTVIDSTTLKVNPLATIVLSGGGTACDDGSTIDVNFNTTSGTPPFSINYSIGINPYLISNANPNHTISTNQTGIYTITGLTDSKGCTAKSISGSANVVLIPVNESNITATPERTDIDDPIINFINTASHSVTGTWDFGDGENLNSSINKVSHIYADTGTFIVSFTTAGNGCSEIAYQTVIIDPTFSIFIPNAFTPNSNQSNDYFLPIVKNVAEYDFSIYNRLGERVFNTKDINIGWNGKPYNDGKFSEAGVYIYAIVITDTNGKVRTFEGTVTLIR